jgi:glycosyltransferase involved in cell wall biosynthesis
MRVGIVSEYFDPEGGSAVIPGFIARSLVKRGIDIEVLTGFPNYPGGRIYAGYRQAWYRREQQDDVIVHRVPLLPSHSSSAPHRMAAYASFAASATAGLRYLKACDVLLVYSTPVTVGLGPALQRIWRDRPVVTFIQDLWPETLLHSGMAGKGGAWDLLHSMARRTSDAIYRRSDAIAVIAPSMLDALVQRGIPRSRLHLIYNWVPDEVFTASESAGASRNLPNESGPFRVIYAGNLGEPQAVSTIVDAAGHLRARTDIEFVLAGSGVLEEPLRARVERERLTNVRFAGSRPVNEVANLVRDCDAQLVTLAPRSLFDMTIPSKLQFSLGFGRPIIAAVSGDPAKVAAESGAAVVCAQGSGAAIATAVTELAALPEVQRRAMGEAGRLYFERNFSERIGGEALAELLRSTVASFKSGG